MIYDFLKIKASFWIFFLLFTRYIHCKIIIDKFFTTVNSVWKQERRRRSMHHSITHYLKNLAPSDNRLTAILNWKKPKSIPRIQTQPVQTECRCSTTLVPPPLPHRDLWLFFLSLSWAQARLQELILSLFGIKKLLLIPELIGWKLDNFFTPGYKVVTNFPYLSWGASLGSA